MEIVLFIILGITVNWETLELSAIMVVIAFDGRVSSSSNGNLAQRA
jgi:hypothetical protein